MLLVYYESLHDIIAYSYGRIIHYYNLLIHYYHIIIDITSDLLSALHRNEL